MKSIKRGERLTKLLIAVFLIGMCILVVKLVTQASFFMEHSKHVSLGCMYDRDGNVLFDPNATVDAYGYDYFTDVGNLVGDASGMMDNTLVSENMDKLENYSSIFGVMENGKSAVYTTLDHTANRMVYDAFGDYKGTAIAYNYVTGEILVCVSKPNINILDYGDVDALPSGSLICKAFNPITPGSTQKVSTLAAAIESLGYNTVASKRYICNGQYFNNYGNRIDCHKLSGHGEEGILQGFEFSCNPFFAQLVEDMSLDDIIHTYRDMGYSVNGSKAPRLKVDNIEVFRGSTELTDVNDFDTQWGCMGQSRTQVSPCQLMMWQSAIANKSDRVTMPYLISQTQNMFGEKSRPTETSYEDAGFSSKTAASIHEIMLQNGTDYYGNIGYLVGVKSGTAQVRDGAQENNLLVGFVSDASFPIAFCVQLENNSNGNITSSLVSSMLQAIHQNF